MNTSLHATRLPLSWHTMIPPIADSDDPTSQIPWPAARTRQPQDESGVNDSSTTSTTLDNDAAGNRRSRAASPKRLMSTWDLITLSISMAGAQIAWTVELG